MGDRYELGVASLVEVLHLRIRTHHVRWLVRFLGRLWNYCRKRRQSINTLVDYTALAIRFVHGLICAVLTRCNIPAYFRGLLWLHVLYRLLVLERYVQTNVMMVISKYSAS